jgi:hypothetical protein
MTSQMKGYWAIRTDRTNKKLIFDELRAGRLRQGWGGEEDQDLNLIKLKIDQGGRWWEKLSQSQHWAFGNFRMLGAGEDSIQIGDLLLLPNLPEDGLFSLATATGKYSYEPIPNGQGGDDYGHILPVRLLTPNGVNKYAAGVHSDLRRTLRSQNRIWNVSKYAEHLDTLLTLISKGVVLSLPTDAVARLGTAWSIASAAARSLLHEKLSSELSARFKAAEWEFPIVEVLKKYYPPPCEVSWTAGSSEHGADAIVRIPNNFPGESPWLVVVQVKDYANQIGIEVLNQIQEATTHWSKDGKIIQAVIITTAESAIKDFDARARDIESASGVRIILLTRRVFIEWLAGGLGLGMSPLETSESDG